MGYIGQRFNSNETFQFMFQEDARVSERKRESVSERENPERRERNNQVEEVDIL